MDFTTDKIFQKEKISALEAIPTEATIALKILAVFPGAFGKPKPSYKKSRCPAGKTTWRSHLEMPQRGKADTLCKVGAPLSLPTDRGERKKKTFRHELVRAAILNPAIPSDGGMCYLLFLASQERGYLRGR